MGRVVEPKLRLHQRFLPWAEQLPFLRWFTAGILIFVLAIGGVNFWQHRTVGALEFTTHVVGQAKSAIGVLDITTADLDGDKDQDIITTGLDGTKVYENKKKKTFAVHIVDGDAGERVQVGDIDRDGQLDLFVTLKGNSNAVRWYRNVGTLEYSSSGNSFGTGSEVKAALGDLDGDKIPDVATATSEGGEVVVRRWMNTGNATFTATILATNAKVTTVAIGDIDGNGYGDIVTGGENGLQRWSSSNGTTWTRNDVDDQNKNRTYIQLEDFSGDGRIDILTADQTANVVALYRNRDNTTWQRTVINSTEATDATTVRGVDLDGDGDTDVVVAAQDDNSVVWFDQTGTFEFTKKTITTNLQSVFGVGVADVDGDTDLDVIAADHFRGTVYWYERVRAKPVATKPSNIQQSTDGSGRISFETTLSDEDNDLTRLRLQYSTDGTNWYKPWLTKVTASAGSVNLKNSDGYQVGSSNAIDTNNSAVQLTLMWDTKSSLNTGGPLTGEVKNVQLRVIPRDNKSIGATVTSSTFVVDNGAPRGATLTLTSINENAAELTWVSPADQSGYTYTVYYGTNETEVLEKRSAAWDATSDSTLADSGTTTTTITGLTENKKYFFKLFITDDFGNEAATSSVSGRTEAAPTPAPGEPTPEASPGGAPGEEAGTPPPVPTEPGDLPTTTPGGTPPSVFENNQAPVADAGVHQVVNPLALVILDGTASYDPDKDPITFDWRQLEGSKVELLSERTATPSFAAGGENETYIFAVTVRDARGAAATDTVTIATKVLPAPLTAPVEVTKAPDKKPLASASSSTVALLRLLDTIFFSLSLLSTSFSLIERLLRAFSGRRFKSLATSPLRESKGEARSRVVHYKTGEPVAGAHVLVYGSDGKLRSTTRTNTQGYFEALFPPGQYSLGVEAPGFTFAGTAALTVRPEVGILYTGGKLTVPPSGTPLPIIIPMKPTVAEVSSTRVRILHLWQTTQRVGRLISWPIFLGGALLNTVLVFISPGVYYLVLEVFYVVLVVVKIALEIRVRPAYGLVRDAITHVPLDLAVVRLFTADTNRLVMTRVTGSQGKFFALPPPGKYTVTVTKPGYGAFSKQNVMITDEHDATLQMTADLIPVAPRGALQQVRAAVVA